MFFFGLFFFQNYACGAKNFTKTGFFLMLLVLWESSENHFGQHKIFFEITPPIEKKLDPPLTELIEKSISVNQGFINFKHLD